MFTIAITLFRIMDNVTLIQYILRSLFSHYVLRPMRTPVFLAPITSLFPTQKEKQISLPVKQIQTP